jgi:type IV pilus assembly protein PilB
MDKNKEDLGIDISKIIEEKRLATTGAILLIQDKISEKQLLKAREERREGENISDTIQRLGLVKKEDYESAFQEKLSLDQLNKLPFDPELIKKVTYKFMSSRKTMPLFQDGRKLFVLQVREGEDDISSHLNLLKVFGCQFSRAILTSEEDFDYFLDVKMGKKKFFEKSIDIKFEEDEFDRLEEPLETERGIELYHEEDPAVVKTINMIISNALEKGATDIHFEPERNYLRIRCRKDGILEDEDFLPDYLSRRISARIKVMSKLDISVNFKAQDGRISVPYRNKDYSFRVSILPSIYGESVVLRALPTAEAVLPLVERGFPKETLIKFQKLIKQPNGIILVTGPTGSGKSSTLFSALSEINTPEKKIVTLEDPIEYYLPNIVQSNVDSKRGHSFASGLRAILRHDPEVILIGEIRDLETAEIAFDAAQTGHLVLSTLHTNDAPRAISRLIDIGIPGYLIEEYLIGVLAQRLIRKVCKNCREAYFVDQSILREMGFKPKDPERKVRVFRVKIKQECDCQKEEGCTKCRGCTECSYTGYRERTGIFELLVIDEEIRKIIRAKGSSGEIRQAALASGMVSLKADGVTKALNGITTLEEVKRQCGSL